MASAEYEETYVDGNVRRNIQPRSYEEINAYENEKSVIGVPSITPAMPPPQLFRKPPQQDAERSREMKKYGLKWLIVAFVIVSVIFAGMFAAVFVIITTVREQGGTHKLRNETEYLGQDFQSRMAQLENKLKNVADQGNDRLDWIMDHMGLWYKASNGLSYKLFTKEKNHTDAESDCQRIGARLVSTGIRSQSVRSEIWTNVVMSKAKRTWIGLNQPYITSGNDSWIWMDGAAYDKLNTPWHSGEPNNYDGTSEDCAHILDREAGGIRLNDDECDKDFAYICEREP